MAMKRVFINLSDTRDAFDNNIEYIQGTSLLFYETEKFPKKLIDIMSHIYRVLNSKTLTITVMQYFFKSWNEHSLKHTSNIHILMQIKISDKYKECLAIIKTKQDLKQLKREISVATTLDEIENAIESYKLMNKRLSIPKQNDLILIGD